MRNYPQEAEVSTMEPKKPVIKDGEYEIRLPQYERIAYKQIFYNPNGYLFANVTEDFFTAAKSLAQELAENRPSSAVGESAALFLARHYLELALKSVAHGLRRLERRTQNAPAD